jgi:hypothetical protein
MKISVRCDSVAHTPRNHITAEAAETSRLVDSLCAFAILMVLPASADKAKVSSNFLLVVSVH